RLVLRSYPAGKRIRYFMARPSEALEKDASRMVTWSPARTMRAAFDGVCCCPNRDAQQIQKMKASRAAVMSVCWLSKYLDPSLRSGRHYKSVPPRGPGRVVQAVTSPRARDAGMACAAPVEMAATAPGTGPRSPLTACCH